VWRIARIFSEKICCITEFNFLGVARIAQQSSTPKRPVLISAVILLATSTQFAQIYTLFGPSTIGPASRRDLPQKLQCASGGLSLTRRGNCSASCDITFNIWRVAGKFKGREFLIGYQSRVLTPLTLPKPKARDCNGPARTEKCCQKRDEPCEPNRCWVAVHGLSPTGLMPSWTKNPGFCKAFKKNRKDKHVNAKQTITAKKLFRRNVKIALPLYIVVP
jgi:hypothetical protein